MARPEVNPPTGPIRVSGPASGFEILSLSALPSDARVTARVVMDGAAGVSVRVERLAAFTTETITFTPDDPLPDGLEPKPQTEVFAQLHSQSDGVVPLPVKRDMFLRVTFAVDAVTPGFGSAACACIVEADAWEPVTVPIAIVERTA